MREVTAMGEIHAHNGVAEFQHSEISGHVGLGAAVRLDVHVFSAKELLAAFACQFLSHVYASGAAVVAFAWVAFRILVGHDAALGFHDRSTCEVL